MRDNSNKKLIGLGILTLLCMLTLYRVVSVYRDKENSPTVIEKEVIVADEEISLGDGCAEWNQRCTCSSGTLSGTRCAHTSTKSGVGPNSCSGGSWSNGVCTSFTYTNATCVNTTCKKCDDDYKLSDGECVAKSCADYSIGDCPSSKGCSVGYYGSSITCTSTSNLSSGCSRRISSSGGATHASPGDNIGTVTVLFAGSDCNKTLTATCTNCNASCSCSGNTCTCSATAGSQCGPGSFSTSVGGGSSFVVRGSWNSSSGTASASAPKNSTEANERGFDYYIDEKTCKNGTCDIKEKRGCGGSSPTLKCYNKGDRYVVSTSPKSGWNEVSMSLCSGCFLINDTTYGHIMNNVNENIKKLDDSLCTDPSPPEPEPEPACYKKSNGELVWTDDESVGTKTSYSKSSCKNCYANNKIISLATGTPKWGYSNEKTSGFVFVPGINKESECVAYEKPKLCEPKPINATPVNKETNVCEEIVSISQKDGMSCEGNSFYNIDCATETDTKFVSDEYATDFLTGQGIKLGVYVRTIRNCKATFNETNWETAYNRTKTIIAQANADLKRSLTANEERDVKSKIEEMKTLQNTLMGFVTAYNNYQPNNLANDEATSFTMNYKVDHDDATITKTFDADVVSSGKGEYCNDKEVNLKDVESSIEKNPHNYSWSNVSNPRIVKLIPPKTYIEKMTGTEGSAGLDGGNKIYIDYYTSPGVYTMNINVETNGNTITNNKCTITVKESDLLYRPIDVNNPFIGAGWTPGENWLNSNFDFRNIIHG